ncbi:MAG: methyltransferase [Thermoplasmata archaeon]
MAAAEEDRAEDDPGETTQYFATHPRVPSQRRTLRFLYRGKLLNFEVDRGVFGSQGLDPGTALLIEALEVRPTDHILDLGCGWGAIGVAAARSAPEGLVVLTDVNRRAIQLARSNLRRNLITNAEVRAGNLFQPIGVDRFDVIATNPPYHAGRPVILRLLTEAPAHLAPDGRLLLVGKGSQGIRYYQEWLRDRWGAGSVEVRARSSGYRVLEARPRGPTLQT